jgi:leucyl-tRNA---protein transferase
LDYACSGCIIWTLGRTVLVMSYLKWNQKTISDFSEENITTLYNDGYVFTRLGKGAMDQTRSVRINLEQFELSSENRRILRKTEDLQMTTSPLPVEEYDWQIGKLAKDFYDTKFGEGTFSANKVKELLSDAGKSNFNKLITYVIASEAKQSTVGHCIAFENDTILHYSYPFYNLEADKNTGMGMMLKAIEYAKASDKKYIYLGSAQRSSDTYKLQFKGLEWFDGEGWTSDAERLKEILINE